jgi:peptide/nickel transport system substrate-binding protein
MTFEIERRALLQMLGLGVTGAAVLSDSLVAFAQGADAVTIG